MKDDSDMRTLGLLVAITLFLGSAVEAADWPQWRGPARDGRSADTGLLTSWPEGGPPLAWRASGFGGGFSSVSVAGARQNWSSQVWKVTSTAIDRGPGSASAATVMGTSTPTRPS